MLDRTEKGAETSGKSEETPENAGSLPPRKLLQSLALPIRRCERCEKKGFLCCYVHTLAPRASALDDPSVAGGIQHVIPLGPCVMCAHAMPDKTATTCLFKIRTPDGEQIRVPVSACWRGSADSIASAVMAAHSSPPGAAGAVIGAGNRGGGRVAEGGVSGAEAGTETSEREDQDRGEESDPTVEEMSRWLALVRDFNVRPGYYVTWETGQAGLRTENRKRPAEAQLSGSSRTKRLRTASDMPSAVEQSNGAGNMSSPPHHRDTDRSPRSLPEEILQTAFSQLRRVATIHPGDLVEPDLEDHTDSGPCQSSLRETIRQLVTQLADRASDKVYHHTRQVLDDLRNALAGASDQWGSQGGIAGSRSIANDASLDSSQIPGPVKQFLRECPSAGFDVTLPLPLGDEIDGLSDTSQLPRPSHAILIKLGVLWIDHGLNIDDTSVADATNHGPRQNRTLRLSADGLHLPIETLVDLFPNGVASRRAISDHAYDVTTGDRVPSVTNIATSDSWSRLASAAKAHRSGTLGPETADPECRWDEAPLISRLLASVGNEQEIDPLSFRFWLGIVGERSTDTDSARNEEVPLGIGVHIVSAFALLASSPIAPALDISLPPDLFFAALASPPAMKRRRAIELSMPHWFCSGPSHVGGVDSPNPFSAQWSRFWTLLALLSLLYGNSMSSWGDSRDGARAVSLIYSPLGIVSDHAPITDPIVPHDNPFVHHDQCIRNHLQLGYAASRSAESMPDIYWGVIIFYGRVLPVLIDLHDRAVRIFTPPSETSSPLSRSADVEGRPFSGADAKQIFSRILYAGQPSPTAGGRWTFHVHAVLLPMDRSTFGPIEASQTQALQFFFHVLVPAGHSNVQIPSAFVDRLGLLVLNGFDWYDKRHPLPKIEAPSKTTDDQYETAEYPTTSGLWGDDHAGSTADGIDAMRQWQSRWAARLVDWAIDVVINVRSRHLAMT